VLTVDDGNVYWANMTTAVGAIRAVRKDGSNPRTLVANIPWISGLAVDGDAVYWASYAEHGSVGKVAK
jgi:hypothetical protein